MGVYSKYTNHDGVYVGLTDGTLLPLLGFYLSDATTAISTPSPRLADVLTQVRDVALKLSLMGVGVLFAGFFQIIFLEMSALRQTTKMKKAYMNMLIRKEMAWYDVSSQHGALTTRISSDLPKVQKAIGKSIGILIQSVAQVCSGLVFGLVGSWRLTLVILAMSPLLVISMAFLASVSRS